jgi:hypothetical protein
VGAAFIDAEEQLWRKRENAAVRLPMQERSVVDRLPRAQPRIERRRAALRFDRKRGREVQLIHISGANPFVNRGDAPGVFGLSERKFRGDLRLRRSICRLRNRQLAAESLELRRLTADETPQLVIECVAPRVDPKPGQRLA